MTRRIVIAVALFLLPLPGCSDDALVGTASRTLRNVCARAPNCTTYDENGERNKELDPWDTRR